MAVVIGFFIKLLFFNQGLEEEYTFTNIFLLLLGVICIPKMLFALFSLIPKIGVWLGGAAGISIVYIVLYGITIGFSKLQIREIVYSSPNVPESFDGYKIVQISDAHTGSFRGPYQRLLKETVDRINRLNPDMICFVGDIENFSPMELEEHKDSYSRLQAKDGVISIMGNHDYSAYIKVTDRERAALVQQTKDMERSFGWRLLENESLVIRRNNDSITVIGEENWGKPPFPQYGNIRKAVKNLAINEKLRLASPSEDMPLGFILMLTHDPNAWEEHVIPVVHPDITLSGHTHGTQFSLFGWSPSSMVYKYWGGEYHKKGEDGHDMMLNVSTGMGGNFPFRFNMPREVVIITLKHKR